MIQILALSLTLATSADSTRISFEDVKQNSIGRYMPVDAKYLPVRYADKATFDVVHAPLLGHNALRVCADNASGFLRLQSTPINLEKTPIVTWKWRVNHMNDSAPVGDAVAPIVLVFYTGGRFRQELLAYAWSNNVMLTSSKWNERRYEDCQFYYTVLRDSHAPRGEWLTQKQNVRKDFYRAFGYIPKEIYVGVKILTSPSSGYAEALLGPLSFEQEQNKK